MAAIEQVEQFLSAFKVKLSIWGVLWRDDRKKNVKTLLELEITQLFGENVLKELKPSDYCDGPITDALNKGRDLWIFGVSIKNIEVYIKVSIGDPCTSVKCTSFHVAEFPLSYPLK